MHTRGEVANAKAKITQSGASLVHCRTRLVERCPRHKAAKVCVAQPAVVSRLPLVPSYRGGEPRWRRAEVRGAQPTAVGPGGCAAWDLRTAANNDKSEKSE